MAGIPHDGLHEVLCGARVPGDSTLGVYTPDGPEYGDLVEKEVLSKDGNETDLSAEAIAALPLHVIASIHRAVKGAPH